MPADEAPDVVVELDKLMTDLTTALAVGARNLRTEFDNPTWKQAGVAYQIPQMSLTISLQLSYNGKTVKGGFLSKKVSTETGQEVTSTLGITLVAVPPKP